MQMWKVIKMRLLRNPRVLLLLCSPILLAGCQHPQVATSSHQQFTPVNYTFVESTASPRTKTSFQSASPAIKPEPYVLKTVVSNSPKPKYESLVASSPKQSDCLTLQLGDALLDAFKTFTDRH
jgi:hypothetical protein